MKTLSSSLTLASLALFSIQQPVSAMNFFNHSKSLTNVAQAASAVRKVALGQPIGEKRKISLETTVQEPLRSGVAIKEVHMARDDGSGNPGEETDSYEPSDRTFHCLVTLTEAKSGTQMRFLWWVVDADNSQNEMIKEIDYTTRVRENVVHGHLTLPQDWPTGKCKVQIYFNGDLDRTVFFSVTAGKTPLKTTDEKTLRSGVAVKEVHMAKDDGHGNPGEETESFEPGDRTFHCVVTLNEAKSGTKMRFVWWVVDADGSQNEETKGFDYSTKALENIVHSHLTLPQDWPVGKYKTEVYVNGDLESTAYFSVKERKDSLKMGN